MTDALPPNTARAGFPRFDIAAKVLDCGREPDIGDYDAADARAHWPLLDYSSCDESPDQREINDWLRQQDLQGKRLLHIGTGNSSVARQCAANPSQRTRYITSVTVSPKEKAAADQLQLPDYTTVLANKYGKSFVASQQGRQYDYVLDNNIASFVCCQRHLERYLQTLVDVLAKDGVIVTHWLGMQWTLNLGVNDVETVWRMDHDKLETIASTFGLSTEREQDLFLLRRR